jgi:hypothetical protein
MTAMGDPHRDAFGRLIVDPSRLTQRELIDSARRVSGTLLASTDCEMRRFGAGLGEWLRTGGDLAAVLGLRPPRGSHRTASRVLATEHRDRLLMRLVIAVGSQARARRILAGDEAAPAAVAALAAELKALRAPTSRRAIVDAVRRARG